MSYKIIYKCINGKMILKDYYNICDEYVCHCNINIKKRCHNYKDDINWKKTYKIKENIEDSRTRKGEIGIEGPMELNGEQGKRGIEGPMGANGEQGKRELEGPMGPKGEQEERGIQGPPGQPFSSFGFNEQYNLPIGPIGINRPINIPRIVGSDDVKLDGLGSVIMKNPGTYVVMWSIPVKSTSNVSNQLQDIVISLNNISTGEIISRSSVCVDNELPHTLVGMCIFLQKSSDNIIQLTNSSKIEISIPIQEGAGLNSIGSGANFIVFRIA